MAAVRDAREARAILGDDVLAADEVAAAFGAVTAPLPPIPFSRRELSVARQAGEMLVLRVARTDSDAPLTLLRMADRFPELFDQKLLQQMGYQLRDDWGIRLEPLAATETCVPGWALARKEILDDSRNLTYQHQEASLVRYAEKLGVPAPTVRRRSAVEAVYDTLLCCVSCKVRLLAKTWDWSSSRTLDGGYLNIGGFGTTGLQILSFSGAVRHGALGICPTRQAPA
jgi:hypothetical protein